MKNIVIRQPPRCFWGFSFLIWSLPCRPQEIRQRSEPARVAVEAGASSWLLCLSEREFGCKKLAGRTEVGYLQYVALAVGLIERQSELISAKEILPIFIVLQRIGHINIGPHGESFAFRFGRALHVLVKLETKNTGRLDLGAEWIEQTDIKVYPGLMCLVSGNILGQRWNVDSFRSVACTDSNPIETIVSVRRGRSRR